MKNSSAFLRIIEAFAWLKIAAAPFIVFAVAAFIVRNAMENENGRILFWILLACGVAVGVLTARLLTKKISALDFNSKVSASPDLDQLSNNK